MAINASQFILIKSSRSFEVNCRSNIVDVQNPSHADSNSYKVFDATEDCNKIFNDLKNDLNTTVETSSYILLERNKDGQLNGIEVIGFDRDIDTLKFFIIENSTAAKSPFESLQNQIGGANFLTGTNENEPVDKKDSFASIKGIKSYLKGMKPIAKSPLDKDQIETLIGSCERIVNDLEKTLPESALLKLSNLRFHLITINSKLTSPLTKLNSYIESVRQLLDENKNIDLSRTIAVETLSEPRCSSYTSFNEPSVPNAGTSLFEQPSPKGLDLNGETLQVNKLKHWITGTEHLGEKISALKSSSNETNQMLVLLIYENVLLNFINNILDIPQDENVFNLKIKEWLDFLGELFVSGLSSEILSIKSDLETLLVERLTANNDFTDSPRVFGDREDRNGNENRPQASVSPESTSDQDKLRITDKLLFSILKETYAIHEGTVNTSTINTSDGTKIGINSHNGDKTLSFNLSNGEHLTFSSSPDNGIESIYIGSDGNDIRLRHDSEASGNKPVPPDLLDISKILSDRTKILNNLLDSKEEQFKKLIRLKTAYASVALEASNPSTEVNYKLAMDQLINASFESPEILNLIKFASICSEDLGDSCGMSSESSEVDSILKHLQTVHSNSTLTSTTTNSVPFNPVQSKVLSMLFIPTPQRGPQPPIRNLRGEREGILSPPSRFNSLTSC